MHLYENRQRFLSRGIILSALLFAVLAIAMLSLVNETASRADAQQEQLLADSIRYASISCYAIEGRYPPSLQYITSNYGVVINEDRFVVFYDIYADNRAPSVSVVGKGGQGQ